MDITDIVDRVTLLDLARAVETIGPEGHHLEGSREDILQELAMTIAEQLAGER